MSVSTRRPMTSAANVHSPESTSPLDNLQSTASIPVRRLRPSELTPSNDDMRVPLKPEKMRRESRLGLRNLFNRSLRKESMLSLKEAAASSSVQPTPLSPVVSNDSESVGRPSTSSRNSTSGPISPNATNTLSREPSGRSTHKIRGTLAEMLSMDTLRGNPNERTIRFRSSKNRRPAIVIDTQLASSSDEPGPLSSPPAGVPIPRVPSSHGERAIPSAQPLYKTVKTPIATWDPPPLFRAYPQAIKHSRLPASSLSADVILKAHDRKTAAKEAEAKAAALEADGELKSAVDAIATLRKSKSHRRNPSLPRFEWTHKIFVLVTSGYLLQYSGQGAYDRLPEKILTLGKDSAAFAADVFPGKHWVLQVSSAMESDGTMTSDSRSIFSRIMEKKHANNFLMVFENGEDMTSWIAVLRREIESLGGKKLVTETGEAEPVSNDRLHPQASQRNLVIRDPARFSKNLSVDQLSTASWNSRSNRNSFSDMEMPSPIAENGADDDSTSSALSHNGRQLERLRDHPNRVSVVSSIISSNSVSANSNASPTCSPTRSTFANGIETAETSFASSNKEKRRSVQSVSSSRSVARSIESNRQRSSLEIVTPSGSNGGSSNLFVPNFSVPNASGRRFSVVRSPSTDTLSFRETSRASGVRKMPPAAICTLPTVEDSPVRSSKSSATPTTANTFRSPMHIVDCLTPASAPPPQSPTIGSVLPSKRTSRLKLDTGVRSVTLNLPSPTARSLLPSPSPRRPQSTRDLSRANRTSLAMSPRPKAHIASMMSPATPKSPRFPKSPRSPTGARPQTPKMRGPPVSMDKVSISPKKSSASIHPSSAQGQTLRKSFVMEATEAPRRLVPTTPTIGKRASYQTEASYQTMTRFKPLPDIPPVPALNKLQNKPSLTALLPKKTPKSVPPQGLCSVHGGLPSAIDAPVKISTVFHPKHGWAHHNNVEQKQKNALKRASMPIMDLPPPPAPPPTRALPALPMRK